MTTETLIVAGVIVLLVVLTFIGLLSRYRKCASDEILVVFGKAGKKKVVNEKTGKSEEVILPSKIIHGGGTFVMPVIQDWAKMSLKPIQIQVNVTGVSSQMIKVTIPVTLTTGIGTTQTLMQNAASRFLTAKTSEISDQIKDILIGEVRSLMATKLQLEAEGTRKKLLAEAEGKRASLMADKVQAIEMAPALAVQKMIESGLTPEMVVQYKTVDRYCRSICSDV